MINPDWARWIFASVSKYYKDVSNTIGVPIYVEGDDQQTVSIPEYFELRILGPNIVEPTSGVFRITLTVNILVTVAKSQNTKFRIHQIGGLLQSYASDIPIKKLGSIAGDDNTVIFCLNQTVDPVKWVFLGRVDGLLQGVVESKYRATVP